MQQPEIAAESRDYTVGPPCSIHFKDFLRPSDSLRSNLPKIWCSASCPSLVKAQLPSLPQAKQPSVFPTCQTLHWLHSPPRTFQQLFPHPGFSTKATFSKTLQMKSITVGPGTLFYWSVFLSIIGLSTGNTILFTVRDF